MKKRKGSLLNRMFAVLLSAVLAAGMVSNAVPVSVLAAGDSITQDGRKWNIPDTVNISVGEEKYGGITGGGAALYNETYSFASSDSAVATVRAEGGGYTGFYVTGISEGTATITFTCSYKVTNAGETKSVSGSFDVVVTAADKYTVTVNNGTGGGEYEVDATVTITANAPASGEQFDKWEVNSGGVTLADPTSTTTTFAMPAEAVSVTATYKESDTSRVEAAKTVVENALAGITATNETTQANIQGIIDTALSNAGIEGVTVTVGELTKTEATTSGAGSVNGNISISCGAATASVSINKTIAQLAAAKYAVTVHNGTGTGIYSAGDTVMLMADAPASGKQFDRWVVGRGGVSLADPMSSPTTFTMPEQDVDVSATYKDITEEHTHNYGDWQHDDTQHWKVCACGDETGRGNHDFGDWITDKAATATEAGTRHQECQTCGYRQTETIPATGGEPGTGTVTPEVKPGTNAPATNISTLTEELKDMLLTDDEKQQVQNGTNIRIVLEVQDAGNTVSVSEQEAVAQALNGYTVGQYLNIDLYKLVGADRTDITEAAKKIRIVITVPDSLKMPTTVSKTRAFAVIRVHDGGAELLADLDGSADTITIETDRFSTYAIVYKDTANSGGGNGGNDDNHGGDDDNDGGGNDNGGNGNNGGGNDNGGNDNNGGGSNNDNNGNDDSSSNNNSQNNSDKNDTKPDSTKDSEPKTGDATPLELYATLAMIAGFAYLLLYFADRKRGMTEETKKELVSRLVGWAKRGGKIRKCLALAAVFVLLVYYHSIGKKTCAEWKEIYGE